MNWAIVLLITISFRVFDFIIAFTSPQFIHFAGSFLYTNLKQPDFLNIFANFDGIHYLDLAKRGYLEPGEFAFFPLYPAAIKLIQFLTFHNYFIAGMLVSFLSFCIGLFFFTNYLKLVGLNKKDIWWTTVFLILFPTAFYFNAIYTESFFFMLTIITLYFLKKKQYLWVFIFAFLASTTRLIGLFLFVPILYHAWKILDIKNIFSSKNMKLGAIIASPFLGLFSFAIYLWITYGDPLKFITAQKEMGEQRASLFILFPQVIYRYIKIFITADYSFQYFVALIEFVVFCSFLAILIYALLKSFIQKKNDYVVWTLGVFSLINLLLPTFTGSLSSIPRYALLSLYVFIFLGQIKSTSIKISIAVLFFIFHILLLGFFAQGYFVS